MEYEITITVDTNDADYRTQVNKITEKELDTIMPLIKAIKEFQPYTSKDSEISSTYEWSHGHNYPTEDCCREDLGEKPVYEYYSEFSEEVHDLFKEYCPWAEYGFHTIESIELGPVVKKEKLL